MMTYLRIHPWIATRSHKQQPWYLNAYLNHGSLLKRQVIMIPERWGSSEKDSKARPPRGFLWILQVGASRRTDDLALASSAKNSPAFWISSGSKVDAREVEHCSQLNVGSLKIKRFGLQEGIEWELKQSEMILERPKTTTIKGTTTVTH